MSAQLVTVALHAVFMPKDRWLRSCQRPLELTVRVSDEFGRTQSLEFNLLIRVIRVI
jgi:hypothetical protein